MTYLKLDEASGSIFHISFKFAFLLCLLEQYMLLYFADTSM